MTIRPITIFYSWQSDLPNQLNRGFIEDALERAAKEVKLRDLGTGSLFNFTAAVDRDTQGHLGTPDIAATIFTKIESADIFVGDVSIINNELGRVSSAVNRLRSLVGDLPRSSTRVTPNPNVMAELGFAAGRLGWERVICVCNEAYGPIEALPFDLRGRSVVPYRLTRGQDKAEIRKVLVGRLKARLAPLFQSSWQTHRPHPLRFAAYDDVVLPMNRFLGLLAQVNVQARSSVAPAADWSSVLSQENIREALGWASADALISFAGGAKVKLLHQFVRQGAELRNSIEKVLTRYGDQLAPILYEALHHLEKGILLSVLGHVVDIEAADVKEGIRRPRLLAFYVHFEDRDLRALRTIAEWCESEREVLSAFEAELRPFTSPAGHSGTPGVWRIDDMERQRQLAHWNDPERGRAVDRKADQ